MQLASIVLAVVPLSLLACGGDDGGAAVDGAVDAPLIDTPPVGCTVSTPGFGDAGTITGEMSYVRIGSMGEQYLGMLRLEAGSPWDGLLIDLQAGSQNSPGPLEPATIALTGRETNSSTCGHCVRVWTNLVGTTPSEWVASYDGDYMASGGTMVIDAIDHQLGGTVDLTLANVTLRHVPAGDGCVTAIMNAHVVATLVPE